MRDVAYMSRRIYGYGTFNCLNPQDMIENSGISTARYVCGDWSVTLNEL